MKLRYHMRGLGVGIIVTALLMGAVKGERTPLSDAEIKARASELGMVESDSLRLSDISNMASSSEESKAPEKESGSGAGEDYPEEKGGGAANAESGAAEDGGADGEPDEEEPFDEDRDPARGAVRNDEGNLPDTEGGEVSTGSGGGQGREQEEDGNLVTVVIEEGVTSYSVCQLLEELGLIEDADSLDYYICSNSYSRSIQQGTYRIPRGTSQEDIVRIIMGNG